MSDPTGLRADVDRVRAVDEKKNGLDDKSFRHWTEKTFSGALLFLLVAIVILFIFVVILSVQVHSIHKDTLKNRMAGYFNRAVECQVVVNTGANLPSGCLDPNVVHLYSSTPGLATNFRPDVERMICEISVFDHLPVPAGCNQ